MSEHKPLADAKAIEHLDFDITCQIHMHGYSATGEPTSEIEPPCTARASLLVTYHSVANCAVLEHFCCGRHFQLIFAQMPQDKRNCPVCGARRFRTARPLLP